VSDKNDALIQGQKGNRMPFKILNEAANKILAIAQCILIFGFVLVHEKKMEFMMCDQCCTPLLSLSGKNAA